MAARTARSRLMLDARSWTLERQNVQWGRGVMGRTEDRWKNLEVWRLADEFVLDTYRATRQFPGEELYGITSQLRRAVVSVPTNIVEGYSRRGDRELVRFLEIALGSLGESKYLLHLSHRLDYLSGDEYERLLGQADRVGQKLYRFYETVSKGAPTRPRTPRARRSSRRRASSL